MLLIQTTGISVYRKIAQPGTEADITSHPTHSVISELEYECTPTK